jgi:hypothetical protein
MEHEKFFSTSLLLKGLKEREKFIQYLWYVIVKGTKMAVVLG